MYFLSIFIWFGGCGGLLSGATMLWGLHLVFVAWARVVCLICAPRGAGAGGVHVRWATRAHVINTKCLRHGWSA